MRGFWDTDSAQKLELRPHQKCHSMIHDLSRNTFVVTVDVVFLPECWCYLSLLRKSFRTNMPRSKALSCAERWRQKSKSWPNMSLRRDDRSNEELDGPSTEASEEQGCGDRSSLPEYEAKPSQEELCEALDAGTRGPSSSQEDGDERAAVILKSKVTSVSFCSSPSMR